MNIKKEVRTIPHKRYITPTKEEVKRIIPPKIKYSYEFIKDVANAYSFIQEEERVENCFTTCKEKYNQDVQLLIKSLDLTKYTGNTPVEKAVSVMTALNKSMKKDKVRRSSELEKQNGEEEISPMEFLGNSIEETIEKAKEMEEHLVRLRKLKDVPELNPEKKRTVEEILSEADSEILETLDCLGKIEKKGKMKAMQLGERYKIQRIQEYSEVSKANLVQVAMPTFSYKLATKQLPVRRKMKKEKQALVLLIDDSGSMNERHKKSWLKAIIINRLQAVIDGKAELIITWFVTDVVKESTVVIDTKEKAQEYLSQDPLYIGDLNGGGTNIQQSIDTAQEKFIKNKTKKTRAQIVVINDGDDKVEKFYTPKYPTHVIILGRENRELQESAVRSGGSYDYIKL